MTISIPQSLFDKYNETMDYWLESDQWSRICTIFYPARRTTCEACNVGLQGSNSTNIYSHGGPAPFGNDNCVYCGGNGFKDTEVTDSIRLRIYWNKKNWIGGTPASIPQADVQVIGKISDLPKLLQADSIQLVSEGKSVEQSYRLAGEPFYHGFGKNRYFMAYLNRT